MGSLMTTSPDVVSIINKFLSLSLCIRICSSTSDMPFMESQTSVHVLSPLKLLLTLWLCVLLCTVSYVLCLVLIKGYVLCVGHIEQ